MLRPLFFILFSVLLSSALVAQSRYERSQQRDLFISETPLEITMEMNIKEVIKDIKERIDHDAVLRYVDDGVEKELRLKVKTRGNTRANPIICSFPPLEINFKKKEVIGTLFDGQNKLKLVTHCSNRNTATKYVMQEYLTYKQYNILTDNSFKVRLLKVKYIDTGNSEEPFESIGILIEDKDMMAERNGMKKHTRRVYHQDQCVPESIDLFTVFQFMIGNTDWSVSAGHNVKVISKEGNQSPVPVPYDFDNAGIINAHYANPAPNLGISDVRTRVFRGFCRAPGEYEKTFDKFRQHKDELVDMYLNADNFTEKQLKLILGYMEDFYEIIDNPKKTKFEILQACRLSHDHVY